MKKTLLSCFLLLVMSITANAQIVKGDMNDDKTVDINDVVSSVNVVLGNQPMEVITAVALGTATITCSANDGSGVTASCTVKVDGHEYVDLGLPSRTLWATTNVGADSPEEYGDYFAWGETTPQSNNADDDAARANWGGDWRMPTRAEFEELIDKTEQEWTKQNNVAGYKFTSKTNGNSIFLPAAGYRWGGELIDVGSDGYYWSSTPRGEYDAYSLNFDSDYAGWSIGDRLGGQSLRPVRKN